MLIPLILNSHYFKISKNILYRKMGNINSGSNQYKIKNINKEEIKQSYEIIRGYEDPRLGIVTLLKHKDKN